MTNQIKHYDHSERENVKNSSIAVKSWHKVNQTNFICKLIQNNIVNFMVHTRFDNVAQIAKHGHIRKFSGSLNAKKMETEYENSGQ